MVAERGKVRFGDTTIEYEVRRSRRRKKTVQVTVDGGGVQVAAPTTVPAGELQAIVRKRASWILKHAREDALDSRPGVSSAGRLCPTWAAMSAWLSSPSLRALRKSALTTGASGFRYPTVWKEKSVIGAYAAWSWSGIAQEPPRACGTGSNIGGCDWATVANRGYLSGTSVNDGAAAPPTAHCASTGG